LPLLLTCHHSLCCCCCCCHSHLISQTFCDVDMLVYASVR
jgi:hypothetical protein